MLPYMPIHYLLFQELKTPVIVLTSGNYSDEPITTRNEDAMTSLVRITDAMLLYNREIHNRTDDSVTFLSGDKLRLIRRSRGFVPAPVELPFQAEGIFSSGAELVNCFCIGKGRQAFLSQHIGDLKNLETLEFYKESISLFVRILRAGITHLVCDLHPDYLSTRFCEEWAGKENLPLHRVQHHHAHIASCMAEKGLSGRVIGISMDGVGFGDDGHIWGGEVMVCDYLMYDRIAHLDYIPQPGGDKATEEPWRMAVAYLIKVFGNEFRTLRLPFLDMVDSLEVDTVVAALGKNINCPLTSSTGRLFDAAAALTGVCVRSGFHAEAPMRLEDIIDPDEKGSYKFDIGKTIATDGIIRGIVDDLLSGTGIPRIATRFHRTMAGIILESARLARSMTGLDTVVLSGGTFQNRFLLDLGERTLGEDGFKVYSHHDTPSNDGGIALGQLAIAAARRSANFNV
jgi:hydrogenase maturation protein HypF